ncbi:hypothetical protein RvY_18562 [Ramazzottius varieornatus]|uniref:Inositol-tetrakisphosphate 1-kinase n=1 Tax=Ramazzottius varieornatus TaxID=947166 RepID=A0A1D1WAM5_RAMVA|nr:hypothetical protein RvY_18562 [Ramazzottius varieornatus]
MDSGSLLNWKKRYAAAGAFPQPAIPRIGYWMSAKKLKKMDMNVFSRVCRNGGFELVQIDFKRPLDQQGPFDIFLHKLTDIIVKAEQDNMDDSQEVELFRVLESYMKSHPETIVIDPIDNLKKLLLRQRQYHLIATSEACINHEMVFTPNFIELYSTDPESMLEDLRRAEVSFPIVCKAQQAHGSSDAHRMMIIFNAAGLQSIKVPCVAQSFVNHDAVLYKVFVIADNFYVVRRPSFENFHSTDLPPVVFDSQNISSASWLYEDPSTKFQSSISPTSVSAKPVFELDSKIVQRIVRGVRKQFGLSLIGIDLIVEKASGRYAIIDVNAFPSYDGVPNFFQHLLGHIQSLIRQRDSQKMLTNGHAVMIKPSGLKMDPEVLS